MVRSVDSRIWSCLLVAASAGALGCIRSRRPVLQSSRSETTAPDSLRAVQIAIEAYRGFMHNARPVTVDSFTRDTGGMLILLGPADIHTRGGGLLVRVRKTGVADIVEVYP